MAVKTDNNLVNLLEETKDLLKEYDLTLADVTVVFRGKVLETMDEIIYEFDLDYDGGWAFLMFTEFSWWLMIIHGLKGPAMTEKKNSF